MVLWSTGGCGHAYSGRPASWLASWPASRTAQYTVSEVDPFRYAEDLCPHGGNTLSVANVVRTALRAIRRTAARTGCSAAWHAGSSTPIIVLLQSLQHDNLLRATISTAPFGTTALPRRLCFWCRWWKRSALQCRVGRSIHSSPPQGSTQHSQTSEADHSALNRSHSLWPRRSERLFECNAMECRRMS